MATVKQVAQLVERLFPPENVCMEDFIGLCVGSYRAQTDAALVCLDCTEAVAREAVDKGIKLIVSHHPLIFGAISTVTDQTPTGRIIRTCIENQISVFCAHTNMDCSTGGINQYVSDLLEMKNAKVLVKNAGSEVGVGFVGDIEPMLLSELAAKVSQKYGDKYVKPYGKDEIISKIAVINGSGGDVEYIDCAANQGATCLITSEIKHHVALYAIGRGVNLIEAGHYASEHVFIDALTELLNDKAREENLKIQFIASENESNPAL